MNTGFEHAETRVNNINGLWTKFRIGRKARDPLISLGRVRKAYQKPPPNQPLPLQLRRAA